MFAASPTGGHTRPAPLGGFERVGEPSAHQFGDYTVVELPLTFKAGEGLGRVALDQEGKVAGLSVQCPRRHRLDPRPVRLPRLVSNP
jgi:hypothetical protein